MNKEERAKEAKKAINLIIPSLLTSDSRAREGIANAERLQDLTTSLSKPSNPLSRPAYTIRVLNTDTITAAISLCASSPRNTKVAILNMASPLRPGGGVLTGATSQEEFLCTRTTLYPSLRDEWYRLPDLGLIYTPDCLIFRDADGVDLHKSERVYVDVVTAAMLRFPDVKQNSGGEMIYELEKDREMCLAKMRIVMRALVMHGVQKCVLGAWGAGAYGNPIKEIADAWKTVLIGHKKRGRKEEWSGIHDVVFAITNPTMAEIFQTTFNGFDQLTLLPTSDNQEHPDPSINAQ